MDKKFCDTELMEMGIEEKYELLKNIKSGKYEMEVDFTVGGFSLEGVVLDIAINKKGEIKFLIGVSFRGYSFEQNCKWIQPKNVFYLELRYVG